MPSTKRNVYRNFITDFRPQRFRDVVGHAHVVKWIKNWLIEKTLPQAILFTGEYGVGKSVMAQTLAKAAACSNRSPNEYEPCGECHFCMGRDLSAHIYCDIGSRIKPDIFKEYITQAKNLGTNMAWMIDNPGQWYPILLEEMHDLPKQVQLDLRKELDEQWSGNTFLVGTSSDPDKIDAALKDRIKLIPLRAPDKKDMMKYVIGICRKTDIPVQDIDAAGVLVSRTNSSFRSILRILQTIRDSSMCLSVDNMKLAAELSGCE